MILKMNSVFDKLYPVTSKFHEIDSAHPTGHLGVDLAMPTGTDILSPTNGIIDHVIYNGESLGNALMIRLGDGSELVLGHLSSINVKEGDLVHIGQKIADSGNTGHSTGAHLHVSLRDTNGHYIDPSHYSDALSKLDSKTGLSFFSNPFKPIQNGFNEVMEFFSPFRDFFVWYKGIVVDVKVHGFLPWLGDQILYVMKMGLQGVLYFDDLIFLMPAIASILAYFLIGRNKYTKYTMPLWFGYFVCEMIKATLK